MNTEIPEWARDDIATPELLAGWLRDRGLLGLDEPVSGDDFVAARALRSGLRSLARLNTTGEAADDELRARLASAFSACELRVEADAAGRLMPVPAGPPALRALAAIAAVVLDAQTNRTWGRLKACRKESCAWLFYDGSRNLSSVWCSMSICGNRTKTASYRRRKAAGS